MKLSSVLKSEFMKYKKNIFLKAVFIIPLVSFIMMFLDMHLRFKWFTSPYKMKALNSIGIFNKTGILLYINHLETLWFMLLCSIILLLSIMVSLIEYSQNTLKELLSRPIGRIKVYLSKWLVIFIFTIIPITMNIIGIFIVKLVFKIHGGSTLILKYAAFETGAALGVISLQQFISSYIKNPLIACGIGFAFIISSFMISQSQILGSIFPYSCVLNAMPSYDCTNAAKASAFGAISCIVWFFIGAFEFKKRDI